LIWKGVEGEEVARRINFSRGFPRKDPHLSGGWMGGANGGGIGKKKGFVLKGGEEFVVPSTGRKGVRKNKKPE